MDTVTYLPGLRSAGFALLAVVIIFMIPCFFGSLFPQDAAAPNAAGAVGRDRDYCVGWTAQAVIFPVAYLATALIFGYLAAQLPGPWPCWLAIGLLSCVSWGVCSGCRSVCIAWSWAPTPQNCCAPSTPTHRWRWGATPGLLAPHALLPGCHRAAGRGAGAAACCRCWGGSWLLWQPKHGARAAGPA